MEEYGMLFVKMKRARLACLLSTVMTVTLGALGVASLPSCYSHRRHTWSPTGDVDAVEGRKLLDHTVRVEVSFTLDATSLQMGVLELKQTGTGVVLEDMDGELGVESLVVTARHVCHIDPVLDTFWGPLPMKFKELTVTTIEGDHLKGQVLVEEMNANDLCVFSTGGKAGTVAALGSSLPPEQARIVHAGAPMGIFGRHTGVVIDGRYSGLYEVGGEQLMVMTIPARGGSSGGGVYYRGRLVGILTRGTVPDGNITMAVQVGHIRSILIEGELAWLRKNT